jgi:PAS domain S-box-containing protein
MPHDPHHGHLIKELTEQLEPVFSHSPQGIYLYLDDTHKTCNKKFSNMIGYSSPQEWVKNEFPVGDVVQKDQQKVIQAYIDASEKFKAASLQTTWMKKDGKKIETTVTMVPITYKDQTFVLHFISLRE